MKPLEPPISVTQALSPDLAAVSARLKGVFDSNRFTNFGPLHNALETLLTQRIGVGNFSLWNNGTNALIGALSQLELEGEVIVTPFTFPATVQSIVLLGLTPVFADIDPVTLTLSLDSVRERITPTVSAVLGTHIYGVQCDTDGFWGLRNERGIRVIYDGAHSLGQPPPYFSNREGSLGDVTMLSFHATKVIHSVEGGGLLTNDPDLHRRFLRARNFGFEGEDNPVGIALNGKLSEVHAAVGLEVLPMVDLEIARRSALAAEYGKLLANIPGLTVQSGLNDSKQYFIVRIDESKFGESRDNVWLALRSEGYMARRYFYPLCSDIPGFSRYPHANDVPVSRAAATECLALPFYGALDISHVRNVAEIVASQQRS